MTSLTMNTFEEIEASEWSLPGTDIKIERRTSREGVHRWAVYRNGFVLSKDLGWEYEPMPSARDDAFIERTRFNSVQDACATLDRALTETLI